MSRTASRTVSDPERSRVSGVTNRRQTLNLVAAVLCAVGGVATLLSAVLSDGPKKVTRASVLSGLFGTIGSLAWAAAALDDLAEQRRLAA